MEGIQGRLPFHELDVFEARLDAATAADQAISRLLHPGVDQHESKPVLTIHKRASDALATLTLAGIRAGYLPKDTEEE